AATYGSAPRSCRPACRCSAARSPSDLRRRPWPCAATRASRRPSPSRLPWRYAPPGPCAGRSLGRDSRAWPAGRSARRGRGSCAVPPRLDDLVAPLHHEAVQLRLVDALRLGPEVVLLVDRHLEGGMEAPGALGLVFDD